MSNDKNRREARVERFTWFLMVMVFAVLYIFPPEEYNIPNFVIPLSGAIILVSSGVYQYSRGWRVSPVTWIGGTIMVIIVAINLYVDPDANYFGLVLLTFAGVIGVGVLTGET